MDEINFKKNEYHIRSSRKMVVCIIIWDKNKKSFIKSIKNLEIA